MKRYVLPLALLGICMAPFGAEANQIHSVIAVDFLTVEVEMSEALTPEELQWKPGQTGPFSFQSQIRVTGAPQLQPYDGFHEHVYRIPVNGMDTDIIYKISYDGQKPKTFKVYDEQETEDRYRDRYGSYF